jgi:hypothetical protein
MDFTEIIPSRYRISYDTKTGAFWILDCWHETVKNLPDIENAVIPENSPAVIIISSEQANALIGEQIKLGWFDKLKVKMASPGVPPVTHEDRINISTEQLAINKIADIATDTKLNGVNEQVAKEAISAIRELGSKK